MRWQPPSERIKMLLLLPLIGPIVLAGAAVILPCVPFILAVQKFNAWKMARNAANPHREWFAWRPVRFNGFWEDVPTQWLWLERVQARWQRTEWAYMPLGFVSKHDERPA